MSDNLSIIITVIILVVLIIFFPLYNYFERQDSMTYNMVLKETTNFVDQVLSSGYMTQDMYRDYITKISGTGNFYDIQLEAHRKVLLKDPNSDKDEYVEEYFVDYNDDIFENNTSDGVETFDEENSNVLTNIDQKVLKNNVYFLEKGDKFFVKLKNTNTTLAGAIFNTIIPTNQKERIVVNYGGIVKNNAWRATDSSDLFQKDIYVKIDFAGNGKSGNENQFYLNDNNTYTMTDDKRLVFYITLVNCTDDEATILNNIREHIKLVPNDTTDTVSTIDYTKTNVTVEKVHTSTGKYKVTFNIESVPQNTYSKTYHVELEAKALQGPISKNKLITDNNKTARNIIILKGNSSFELPTLSIIGNNSSDVVEVGSDIRIILECNDINTTNLDGIRLNLERTNFENTGEIELKNAVYNASGNLQKVEIVLKGVIPTDGASKNLDNNVSATLSLKGGWGTYSDSASNTFSETITCNFQIKTSVYDKKDPNTLTSFTIPISGVYRIQLWGAQGGDDGKSASIIGGKGGFTSGTIYLTEGTELLIAVGGKGERADSTDVNSGLNGGGIGGSKDGKYAYTGGGATYVRMSGNTIMVAGGGGGATSTASGGAGGGTIGENGKGTTSDVAKGATETSGYARLRGESAREGIVAGGGGSGYYGGEAGKVDDASGAGGSGYCNSDLFNGITLRSGLQIGDGRCIIEYIKKEQ